MDIGDREQRWQDFTVHHGGEKKGLDCLCLKGREEQRRRGVRKGGGGVDC